MHFLNNQCLTALSVELGCPILFRDFSIENQSDTNPFGPLGLFRLNTVVCPLLVRIMKVAAGGFDQCYNAQAVVDTASMRVIAPHVTQAANDKQQVEPLLERVGALPKGLNAPEELLADTGYYSKQNVTTCLEAESQPLIAVGWPLLQCTNFKSDRLLERKYAAAYHDAAIGKGVRGDAIGALRAGKLQRVSHDTISAGVVARRPVARGNGQ